MSEFPTDRIDQLEQRFGEFQQHLASLDIQFTQLNERLQSVLETKDELRLLREEQICLKKDSEKMLEDIDELKERNKSLKNWVAGLACAVIGGVILAAVKLVLGL